MSSEAKTVSELCREALELREKATQGEWNKSSGDYVSYLSEKFYSVCAVKDFILPHTYVAGPRISYENAKFIAFTANHIKQIAERCLELESQNKSQGMELARQKAVGALKSISEAESCHNCDWCAACGHGVHYTKQEALGALKELG